jgi:hypothetical protein
MRCTDRRQWITVLAVAAILLTAVAPFATPVAAQENSTATPTSTPTPTETPTTTSTATPASTATPTATPSSNGSETGSTGPPGIADGARLIPVKQNVDFLYVNEHKRGEVYNTSGPFAEFEVDESVDRAYILEQSGARADVFASGHMVRVDYEPDAAPVGSSSLYTLRLRFNDGSELTIHLYASQTSVDVAERQMREYRPFILEYADEAEAAGYGREPDDLMSLKEERDRKLQYVDALFIDAAFNFVTGIARLATNPISYIVLTLVIAIATLYSLRRFGWMYDKLGKGAGEAGRLHQILWNKAMQEQQTAKEEPISRVRHISTTDQTIFEDAFGVDTVLDVAELAREGIRVKRDGEVMTIGGVENIDPSDIHASWLAELCRDTRYKNPKTPLTVMKRCLGRMCNTYSQTNHYKETLEETRQLLDELDASRDHEKYRSHAGLSTRDPVDDRGAVGGDD